MAPRGSQLDGHRQQAVLGNLDPWLHEGANEIKEADPRDWTDLDPWLHEGANKNDTATTRHPEHLDPWLHEGANVAT